MAAHPSEGVCAFRSGGLIGLEREPKTPRQRGGEPAPKLFSIGRTAELPEARRGPMRETRRNDRRRGVRGEPEAPVLEDGPSQPALGASDKLAAGKRTRADLIRRWLNEAVERAPGGPRERRPGAAPRVHAYFSQRLDQRTGHQTISIRETKREFPHWGGNGVGQVGTVKHGSAACRPADKAHSRRLAALHTECICALAVSQGEPWAAPPIKPQRKGAPTRRAQEGLIYAHVPGSRSGAVAQ